MTQALETTNEDNQFTGPRPSPTIPDGGSFSCYNKVVINAPPQAVYDALIDISRWKDWNQMVPKVDNTKPADAQTDLHLMAEGMHMLFHAKMGTFEALSRSPELVVQAGPVMTQASNPGGHARTVVRWTGQGFPSFVLRAEHVNWLDDNGDGTTTYQHWETFGGPAVIFMKTMFGKVLHDHFIAWADNLKAHVEKLHAGATAQS